MESNQQTTITLHANKEHPGVRLVVIFVLAAAFFATYIGLNATVQGLESPISDFAFIVSCSSALLVSLGLAAITERFLKRNWPSGQRIELNESGAVVYLKDARTNTIDWSARFTVLKWFFAVKGYAVGGRERRLPKNYFCLAFQLQQDDQRFVVNCYLPSNRVSPIIEGKGFLKITPADYYKGGFVTRWIGSTDRPKIPPNILAGREGPYWLAERRRWTEGLELERDDFLAFLDLVGEKSVEWDDLGN